MPGKTFALFRVEVSRHAASMRPQRNAGENFVVREETWDETGASMRPQRNAGENNFNDLIDFWCSVALQ